MQNHAYQVTYEILHFDKNGNPVEKMWGRTIQNGYGLTEDKACSRNFYERYGNDKVVILESEKISMERYNELLGFDESKLAEITRHHNKGIE